MEKITELFQPGKIGKLEVKNRIVMAAMGTRSADGDGHITQRSIDHYVARARGGVGLIIVESTDPVRESRLPKTNWLHDDCFIPKLRELSQAVHEHGAKIAIQLVHRGIQPRRVAELQLFNRPVRIDICGPSAIPYGPSGVIPREMSREDIKNVVEQLCDGARRAKDAGFDGIEYHGAHGYLLSCFFSPFTNRRTDEYGGSVENRTRIACELIARTRDKIGSDFPIMFKMNGCDYLEGGVEIEEAVTRAQILEEAGVDALEISATLVGSTEWQFLSYLYPPATLTHLAEAIKKAVNVPVFAVGKIGDPFIAEGVLREGKADFVVMGRALLADPQLPHKAREGRFHEIRTCIYCNNCVMGRKVEVRTGDRWMTRCTVNTELLQEREMELKPARIPKLVMVVGGGLAGMQAATVLAKRGHRVRLFEKEGVLGGQWTVACHMDTKRELYPTVTERLIKELDEAEVEVHLNVQVTRELVEKVNPDAVVLATGATPKTLDVLGSDNKIIVQANDVIAGSAQVGNRVVVVGGRLVGMEVADFLARQGKKVALVTKNGMGENGAPLDENIFRTLRRRLIDAGVSLFPYSPVREIRDNGVYVTNSNQILFLAADSVILAVGAKPENKLACELRGLVSELHCIGDCLEPRDALEATNEGAEMGRQI